MINIFRGSELKVKYHQRMCGQVRLYNTMYLVLRSNIFVTYRPIYAYDVQVSLQNQLWIIIRRYELCQNSFIRCLMFKYKVQFSYLIDHLNNVTTEGW